MPYILLKRPDVPNGVLQTLELAPYTSIGEKAYGAYGQTGYRIQPPSETCVLVNAAGVITFNREAEGLAAWFLTNVNDGTGAFATMTMNIAAGNAAPGDTVLVDPTVLGGAPVLFTFSAAPVLPTDVLVGATNIDSAINLAAAMSAPINGLNPYITATPNVTLPGDVDIAGAAEGTAYNGILVTTVGANLAPPGPTPTAGGLDADSLTAAEADQNVQDVLGLFYGIGTVPVAMDLAGINAVLTTGQIVAGDVTSILDILAGRQYVVPAGVQIEAGSAYGVVPAVGATGGPNWDVTVGFRRIYETGKLRISFGEGRLAQWVADDYLAVYNNDGTLYTGA